MNQGNKNFDRPLICNKDWADAENELGVIEYSIQIYKDSRSIWCYSLV